MPAKKKKINSNADLTMVKVAIGLVRRGVEPDEAATEVLRETFYSDIVKERLKVMILEEIAKAL